MRYQAKIVEIDEGLGNTLVYVANKQGVVAMTFLSDFEGYQGHNYIEFGITPGSVVSFGVVDGRAVKVRVEKKASKLLAVLRMLAPSILLVLVMFGLIALTLLFSKLASYVVVALLTLGIFSILKDTYKEVKHALTSGWTEKALKELREREENKN